MQDKQYPEQIFENILQHVNNDPLKELEIRFHSRFMNLQKGDKNSNNVFKSSIQPNVFYEVMTLLRKGAIVNLTECESDRYTNIVINNRSERLIINSNGEKKLMTKTRNVLPRPFSTGDDSGSYIYINPKGFKIGLSTEEIIYDDSKLNDIQQEIQKLLQLSDNSNHKRNIIQRKIQRTTFMQHIHDENGKNPFIVFKFDLSVVHSSDNIDPSFEIELEYVGNKQDQFIQDVNHNLERIAKQFGHNIETMLKLIQKSQVVMTWNEHNSVLSAYNTMLVNSHSNHSNDYILFRGAQPETLHHNQLDQIAKEEYYIADKSDGERAHLLCGKDGTIYFISRFLHVIKTRLKSTELAVSILDVELFENRNIILLFDILIKNGKDVRKYHTKDRLNILKTIDLTKMNSENPDWKIVLKKMYFSRCNSFPKNEIISILNDTAKEYDTDGIVCTPANEPYPFNKKWPNLLKWKPPNLNSIDLYSEKGIDSRSDERGYYLYANSSQILDLTTKEIGILINESNNSYQVQFTDSVRLISKNNAEVLRNQGTEKILFFPFPFLKESLVYNSLMPDKHVIEFIYNLDTKLLEPIRVRHDKSGIGFRGSNFLKIALDTWNTMLAPILKEHLMRYNYTPLPLLPLPLPPAPQQHHTQQQRRRHQSAEKDMRKQGGLSNSFLYHNIIKENMIRKCAEYINTPYYEEMKKFPSRYDSVQKCWIIPAIPEIIEALKLYKDLIYHIKESTDEIIVPTLSESKSCTKLIDLCSGKGGDLWKWIRSNYNFVFGIDNESILLMDQEDAAIKRWKNIKNNKKVDASNISVIFTEMDARARVSDYLSSQHLLYEFDVAACFFAMHYFFGSQRDFDKFVLNIDETLSFGGYYIGMVMNGELLYNLLRDNQGIYEIKDKNGDTLCKIQQKYPNIASTNTTSTNITSNNNNVIDNISMRRTFGLEIEVDIADSILNDYLPTSQEKLNKREYLVDLTKLEEMAKSVGLELIEYNCLCDVLSNNLLHHPNNYNINLTDAEKQFTSLFTCFTFKKKTNSLWKRKMIQHVSEQNETVVSQRAAVEHHRLQYENIWKKKWTDLETMQLDTLKCDTLIYTEKNSPPLFKIIQSKTDHPKKRTNDVNAKLPPVFSKSVKKNKSNDIE